MCYLCICPMQCLIMPSYKLYYFDFHGGAGEPIRNAFRIGKIAFEDARVPSAEWPALKASDKCIYGQMPILEIDGTPYAQSMAILRFVGKITGLYPTDPVAALRVDECLDAMIDMRTKFASSYGLPEAERIAARQKLAEDFIKPHLERVNHRIKTTGGSGGFAVGDSLTVADLAIASDILGLKSGRIDGIDTKIADEFEALTKIIENVQAALAK